MTDFLFGLMSLWGSLGLFQEVTGTFGVVAVIECIYEMFRGEKRYE